MSDLPRLRAPLTHAGQCLGFYTMNAVIVQITYYSGGNVDVTPDLALTLSDADVAILEYGSKLEYTSWYTYPAVICRLPCYPMQA